MAKGADQIDEMPSYRQYSSDCLPKEFLGLSQDTFLTNPASKNICFLPTDILIQICEKLNFFEFISLSLTCRFLHWRIFTFCKCYVPVTWAIHIKRFSGNYRNHLWGFNNGYSMVQDGLLGFDVRQSAQLRKPFLFKLLEVKLDFPFYDKPYYDKCLQYIAPLRRHATDLVVHFRLAMNFNFDYPSTNEFLEATSYRTSRDEEFDYVDYYTDIYRRCPYAQKMSEGFMEYRQSGETPKFPLTVFLNKYGRFEGASYDIVVETMNYFFYGQDQLLYHHYYFFNWTGEEPDEEPLSIIEYLFNRYEVTQEFFSSECGHIWYLNVDTEETGRRHKIRITKYQLDYIVIAIGLEESFDDMDRLYEKSSYYPGWRERNDIWWKMETAVEGDEESTEEEKRETDVDPMAETEPSTASRPIQCSPDALLPTAARLSDGLLDYHHAK